MSKLRLEIKTATIVVDLDFHEDLELTEIQWLGLSKKEQLEILQSSISHLILKQRNNAEGMAVRWGRPGTRLTKWLRWAWCVYGR